MVDAREHPIKMDDVGVPPFMEAPDFPVNGVHAKVGIEKGQILCCDRCALVEIGQSDFPSPYYSRCLKGDSEARLQSLVMVHWICLDHS